MNIFDFFTPKSLTFYLYEDSTIRQAIEKFDKHKFSVIPIIDKQGKYLTSISEGDILRYIKNDANFDIRRAEHTPVMDIDKYRAYRALDLSVPTSEILALALEQNFVPLVDDQNAYIGILKRKAILEYLLENTKQTT